MKNTIEKNKEKLQNLCRNIKAIRKREGLTQREMAKRLKISVMSISKLEKGIVPPRLSCKFLFALRFEFGVKPTDALIKDLTE